MVSPTTMRVDGFLKNKNKIIIIIIIKEMKTIKKMGGRKWEKKGIEGHWKWHQHHATGSGDGDY